MYPQDQSSWGRCHSSKEKCVWGCVIGEGQIYPKTLQNTFWEMDICKRYSVSAQISDSQKALPALNISTFSYHCGDLLKSVVLTFEVSTTSLKR